MLNKIAVALTVAFNTLVNSSDSQVDDDSYFEEGRENSFIKLENVHKTYLLGVEGIAALRGVDLEVKKGEFLMICGTSGGGKSTMLNIIGTIDKPTKGRVTICKKIITPRTSDDELARIRLENLGFVFQTFNLLSTMTAVENVELPLTFLGYRSSKRKEIATKLLQSVQMGERLNHYPNMLSGGEQQRVTIARAMANSPGLLLLDEPTGDLDTLNTNNVMRLLINLNKKGTTLVMVTHDQNLVQYGTRIVYMRDGRVSGQRICSPEDRAAKIAELEEQILMGRDGNRSSDALSIRRDNSSSSLLPSPSATSTTAFKHSSKPPSPSTIYPSSSSSSSVIIPQYTSVREPGDYDPISFADPTLIEGVGYEISVVDYPNVMKVRPFQENPYSNLRKDVVIVRNKFRQTSSATISPRPSSKSLYDQDLNGSQSSTPSSILISTPNSNPTIPTDTAVQTFMPSPESPPS